MNEFESGLRKAIPAVLVYARASDGRILMIHRNGERPGDWHSGKWNGLGGKCEADESPREGARREFKEESGLDLPEERFRALGALTFPCFKPHRAEDWIVFVFELEIAEAEASHILNRGEEGELHWIAPADLLSLNLWPGDRHFLPFVLAHEPFLGTLWYEQGALKRVWIERLGRSVPA